MTHRVSSPYPYVCNTLQHTATHCNTLQHTATHCNTLQHTATHSCGVLFCDSHIWVWRGYSKSVLFWYTEVYSLPSILTECTLSIWKECALLRQPHMGMEKILFWYTIIYSTPSILTKCTLLICWEYRPYLSILKECTLLRSFRATATYGYEDSHTHFLSLRSCFFYFHLLFLSKVFLFHTHTRTHFASVQPYPPSLCSPLFFLSLSLSLSHTHTQSSPSSFSPLFSLYYMKRNLSKSNITLWERETVGSFFFWWYFYILFLTKSTLW